eukprot:11079685-Alexandrium_andersonii.AAC.1
MATWVRPSVAVLVCCHVKFQGRLAAPLAAAQPLPTRDNGPDPVARDRVPAQLSRALNTAEHRRPLCQKAVLPPSSSALV